MWFSRAFHPDEANQAFTTGRLIESGLYQYRPSDHHGPTLYYAAAPIQKAFGASSTASLDGSLLRATPLLFTLITIVLAFIGVRRITSRLLPALAAALLLATAPIVAFHSTYFIQESLLGCFLSVMFLAAACFPSAKRPGKCAVWFGVGAGLAFATKETCVIAFAAAALAAAPALLSKLASSRNRHLPATHCGSLPQCHCEERSDEAIQSAQSPTPFHSPLNLAILALFAFFGVAFLFFSSFGSYWQGVYDAFVTAPLSYLGRAAGSAQSEGAAAHVHEWSWYLKLLFTRHPLFSHLPLLLGLAAVCFTSARRSPWFRFALAYSLLSLLFYSLIPYKTPWCMLTPVQGMILALALAFPRKPLSLPAAPFLAVLALNVAGLVAVSRDPDSKSIPFNYANASPEAALLAQCAADAMKNPSAEKFIAVAAPPEDVWPFPWYNRALESSTGYWTSIEQLAAVAETGRKPSVVIVPMSEGHIAQSLFPHLKNTKRFSMRHRVRMRIFW